MKSERKYNAFLTLQEIKNKGFLKVENPEQVKKDVDRFYPNCVIIKDQKLQLS